MIFPRQKVREKKEKESVEARGQDMERPLVVVVRDKSLVREVVYVRDLRAVRCLFRGDFPKEVLPVFLKYFLAMVPLQHKYCQVSF